MANYLPNSSFGAYSAGLSFTYGSSGFSSIAQPPTLSAYDWAVQGVASFFDGVFASASRDVACMALTSP